MNRFERSFAILLLLRDGRALSATELARRLDVSKRTIYRDIDTLCAAGVPLYAEAGRIGGFRLVEGYFLPPIALSVGEATSLLTGLALLERLRTKPFADQLETAKHKLLAVIPAHLRPMLSQMERIIGFEPIPHDIFHPERGESAANAATYEAAPGRMSEAQIITSFLQSIFDQQAVAFDYASPYAPEHTTYTLFPQGIVWDRDRWYLVGRRLNGDGKPRLWRTDRVLTLRHLSYPPHDQERFNAEALNVSAFNVEDLIGRKWLTGAIASWAENAPVKIRLTVTQAERLKRDWYYAHAHYEAITSGEPSNEVMMTFGEANQSFVFELLRWLGDGAELIAPEAWRKPFAEQLRFILARYE